MIVSLEAGFKLEEVFLQGRSPLEWAIFLAISLTFGSGNVGEFFVEERFSLLVQRVGVGGSNV